MMKNHEADSVQVLHSGAVKALARAVTKAIAQHKSAGVPAAVWRNGKVAYLPSRRVKKRHG